jgi:hypothetical protein
MLGFGPLQTPRDLLAKLQHDLDAMRAEPGSSYAAYNFFVTAEHILDWLNPGDRGTNGEAARTRERKREVLLRIVSHLATGAKHFEPNPKRHESVTHVNHADAPYGAGAYGVGPYGTGELTVTLDGDAAARFGSSISALALGEHVLRYWEAHPGLK